MKYVVTRSHRSEFPESICLRAGDLLTIGERYVGPEGWDDWYFCTTSGPAGGWVPEQVIEWLASDRGQAVEDYAAREVDVDVGETVISERVLNGWVWCSRPSKVCAGWVPLSSMRAIKECPAERLRRAWR